MLQLTQDAHSDVTDYFGGFMHIGDKITFNGCLWRVLDRKDNKVLIITEEVIERRAYHTKYKDTTWHVCDLRQYLNNAFYNSFEQTNRSRILPVLNHNPNNPWYGTRSGNDSQDFVFLLSLDEVCRYFGDSTDKLYHRGNNRYWKKNDVNNKLRLAGLAGTTHCWWWWLRSPGRHNRLAAYVHGTDGCVGVNGNNITNPEGGVRPALWLML